MILRCPHCEKDIELLGASELRAMGLSDNHVQHARDKGKFSEPYLSFGNRKLYLRGDVERYIKNKSLLDVEQGLDRVIAAIAQLTPEEQGEARQMLEKRLMS